MITAKIYISGKISGEQREHYMECFNEAERLLRQLGYVNIVNPVHTWVDRFPLFHRFLVWVLGEQRAYSVILLYDLWKLMGCQRIYKIPGWKDSRGAQIESAVAFNMGMFLISKPEREAIDRHLEALMQKRRADD